MKDCNCKKNENLDENNHFNHNIFIRVLAFSLSLLLIPIIVGYTVYLLFKTFILGKNVDIKGILEIISKKSVNKDDEDDELEDYDEEDLEIADLEIIK